RHVDVLLVSANMLALKCQHVGTWHIEKISEQIQISKIWKTLHIFFFFQKCPNGVKDHKPALSVTQKNSIFERCPAT
ncbi:hypothetical protein, partial [Herbaspirillum sp.]|uniref:hypothetical protein n=1 Tax=Herbaspirillum sp. TaxID=1890675 RepID=UPI002590D9D6